MVTRADGLHASRRGDRVLVVEPLTASWAVLTEGSWRMIGGLTGPTPAATLIAEAVGRGLTPSAANDLLALMHRKGFVHLDGRPHTDWRDLWAREPEVPSFVSLHVVEGCNLRCTYCYTDAGAEVSRMAPDLMERLIEKAIRELPSNTLTIDFLGGEPFLLFDEIVATMRRGDELAESLGKRVDWLMQTNGTFLTRERAIVLASLNVGVGVSIDGPKALHDRYRPRANGAGSWDEVFGNLIAAREEGLRVAPLAVIHEPERYTEALDFFVSHGFEFVRFNYSSVMGRARDGLDFAPERAERFAHGFLDMVRWARGWCEANQRPLRISDLNQMLNILVTKNRDYMCLRSPCGLGDSILSFGTKGEIYACEEFERHTKATFLLGHADARTLPEVVKASSNYQLLKQRRVETIPKCSRCHLRYMCGGGCTHKALAYYGTHMREDPMCRYYQIVFEELMWMIADDRRLAELLGVL